MNKAYNNLIHYIDDLIDCKASYDSEGYQLSIKNLDEEELGHLAYLFLEMDDRDTYDCFIDASKDTNDEITCALINLLKENSYDHQQDLSNLIFKRSINRYKPLMQKRIDERCSYRFASEGNSLFIDHGRFDHYVGVRG
jgi:hypothetical protein